MPRPLKKLTNNKTPPLSLLIEMQSVGWLLIIYYRYLNIYCYMIIIMIIIILLYWKGDTQAESNEMCSAL